MKRPFSLLSKSLLLAVCFLSVFLLNSPKIYAITGTGTTQVDTTTKTEEEKKTNPWEEMWDAISSFFQRLFGVQTYAAKDYPPVTSETTFGFTDYNKDNKDIAIRVASEENKVINKGIFLNDILNYPDKLENRTIAYVCNNRCSATKLNDDCSDIKATTLPHFYYTKGIKILYRPGSSNPIGYDPGLFDPKEVIIDDDACYTNLYETFTPVPQGDFQNKDNAAAASSTQLNRYLRTPIPAASAGEDIPLDNYTPSDAERIIKDNDKQEGVMLQNFIPDVSQTGANLSTNRDLSRQVYTDYMHPDSWGNKTILNTLPEREEDNFNSGTIPEVPEAPGTSGTYTGTCNAERSHCRGMSQYGALGMSKSRMSYLDILRFYYGNVQVKSISSIQNSSGQYLNPDPYVEISMDDADSACANGSSLLLETYLSGLGEMPDYWGNIGGFEALKAQVVAARTYAMMKTNYFTQPICNSSKCQVFQCSNIQERPNLIKAVNATKGLVLVDSSSQKPFLTEYARSFCGPSRTVTYTGIHTNPSVNGLQYEVSANNDKYPFCKSAVSL